MTEMAANELHFEMVFNSTCFQPISVKITNQSEAETRGSVETVHMKSEQQKQTETKVDLEGRKEIWNLMDSVFYTPTAREKHKNNSLTAEWDVKKFKESPVLLYKVDIYKAKRWNPTLLHRVFKNDQLEK